MRVTRSLTVFAGSDGWTVRTHRRGDRKCDRVEVLEGIIGHFAEQGGIDDVALCNNEYSVPVGRRLGGLAHPNIAAGTGYVRDEKLLSNLFGQPLCDEAGGHVGWTAGRIRNDYAHGSVRINLRPGDARDSGERDSSRCQMPKLTTQKIHRVPLE